MTSSIVVTCMQLCSNMASLAFSSVAVGYTILSVVYLIYGLGRRDKGLPLSQRVVLKCAPVVLLSLYTVWTVLGGRTARHSNVLLASLVLSVIGDGLLLFKHRKDIFLIGIIAFASAQICNIVFLGGTKMEGTWQGIVSFILSAFLFFYIIFPRVKNFLIYPIAVYCFLMTVLLWRGLSMVTMTTSKWSATTLMGGLGCVSYYISDLTLGIHIFAMKVPQGDLIIMISYYAAQLLLFMFVFY